MDGGDPCRTAKGLSQRLPAPELLPLRVPMLDPQRVREATAAGHALKECDLAHFQWILPLFTSAVFAI
jgi:hypothetical protein